MELKQKMSINSKWGKSYLIQLAVSFPLQLFTSPSVFPGLCRKNGQSWVITPSFTTTSLFTSQWHFSQLSGFKTSEWNKKKIWREKKLNGLLSNGHVHLRILSALCYLRNLDRPVIFAWNKGLTLAECSFSSWRLVCLPLSVETTSILMN